MKIVSNETEIQDYRDSPALNQSGIKIILEQGIQAYLEKIEELKDDSFYEDKQYFIIGKAVDTLITQGEEVFSNTYYISKLKTKPSETEMAIAKMAFSLAIEQEASQLEEGEDIKNRIGKIDLYEESVFAAIVQHNYQGNWKRETRVSKINSKCSEYWTNLKESIGKQVLSVEEQETILGVYSEDGTLLKHGVVSSLRTHPHTNKFFVDSDNMIILYQVPIYFEVDGIPCKALIDQINIDLENKHIYPFDIKTLTGHVLRFNQSVSTRRYDIQASFYERAINSGINTIKKILEDNSIIINAEEFSEFIIFPLAFIVESTTHTGTPMVFQLDDIARSIAEYGDNRYKQGWQTAINIYNKWDEVDFSVENLFSESRGTITITKDFKYTEIF